MNEYIDIDLTGNDVITDGKALFIQEIALALRIAPGEIWGVYESIDLAKYLFNQYITIMQIRNEIASFISKHCFHSQFYEYTVESKLAKDSTTGKEFIYITCTIFDIDGEGYVNKFILSA